MAFVHGKDGSVVCTAMGSLPNRALEYHLTLTRVFANVAVFNANNIKTLEAGEYNARGTVVVRVNNDDTPMAPGGSGVLTLRTSAAAPYWQWIGSVVFETVPIDRADKGAEADTMAIAFINHVEAGTLSRVAA